MIVDAPDLPSESCSSFITEAELSDTEELTYPDGSLAPVVDEEEGEKFSFETANKVEDIPKTTSKSRIVDPLEAVERSLAESQSKLKGETTKKLSLKNKTVDAATKFKLIMFLCHQLSLVD